jgi:hypothetical protein
MSGGLAESSGQRPRRHNGTNPGQHDCGCRGKWAPSSPSKPAGRESSISAPGDVASAAIGLGVVRARDHREMLAIDAEIARRPGGGGRGAAIREHAEDERMRHVDTLN